jgi:hypothetical protein
MARIELVIDLPAAVDQPIGSGSRARLRGSERARAAQPGGRRRGGGDPLRDRRAGTMTSVFDERSSCARSWMSQERVTRGAWDGRAAAGAPAPGFFYVHAPGFRASRKLVVLK